MTGEDKKYWLELAERYFDATATEEEEAALRRFLATGEAADGAFDEVRAVAGFASAGKSCRRRRAAARRRLRAAVAAAAVVAALVAVLPGLLSGGGDAAEGEVCVAYVGGVEYTDEAVVLAQARSAMDGMGRAADELSPEAQMREMFRLIGE